jgi:hypothetical protein
MSVLAGLRRWAGANLVPLVLIPLAAALVWAGIWRVWLPPAGGGGTAARAVTTVDTTVPARKVTTVVRTTAGASPSRRSEALALALAFVGAALAVVGVFDKRIGSLDLTRTGVKIDLTSAEQSGAAALVGRLAAGGAPPTTYARGLDRYLRLVAARRPAAGLAAAERGRLTDEQAAAIADGIADDIV